MMEITDGVNVRNSLKSYNSSAREREQKAIVPREAKGSIQGKMDRAMVVGAISNQLVCRIPMEEEKVQIHGVVEAMQT